jgi:hypothetical protein
MDWKPKGLFCSSQSYIITGPHAELGHIPFDAYSCTDDASSTCDSLSLYSTDVEYSMASANYEGGTASCTITSVGVSISTVGVCAKQVSLGYFLLCGLNQDFHKKSILIFVFLQCMEYKEKDRANFLSC